jgi:hypothetical protein
VLLRHIKRSDCLLRVFVFVEFIPEPVEIRYQFFLSPVQGFENDIAVIPEGIVPVKDPVFLFKLYAEGRAGKGSYDIKLRKVNSRFVGKREDPVYNASVLIVKSDAEGREKVYAVVLDCPDKIYAFLPIILCAFSAQKLLRNPVKTENGIN